MAMKYVIASIMAFLILFLVVYSKQVSSQMGKTPSIADTQANSIPSPLTVAEDKDLSEMTEQVLRWTAQWQPGPHSFLKGGEVISYSLPQLLNQYAGQDIMLNVVRREASVTIYLVPLHLKYTARRLRSLGLSNPHPEYLAEDTYEACIAAEAQLEERLKSINETLSQLPSKPKTAKNAHTLEQTGVESYQETRPYRIPSSVVTLPEKDPQRDKQTEDFYSQLIVLAQTTIQNSRCSAGKSFYLTVPEFRPSDPAIYLLVSSSHQQDIAVEWFEFFREANSGEFSAYHVKSIELAGEGNYWATKIKQNKINTVKVTCAP
jgi:hypothetical protein